PACHGRHRCLRALRTQRTGLHEAHYECRRPACHTARRRNHHCLPHVRGRQSTKERLMEAVSPTLINLIIFVLAIYVGFHVVWNVTPALHTPLMAVTNAISAIVIVGAMLAAALTESSLARYMGVFAVALAAVNVFGGFLVTRRMLEMFKKKDKKAGVKALSQSTLSLSSTCSLQSASFSRSRVCPTSLAPVGESYSVGSIW